MSFPSDTPLRSPRYHGATTQSLYIPMRDGIRLAVDLSLPGGLGGGEQLPALFAATRYWRAQQLRAPFAWFLAPPDPVRDFFCAYGYALLRIDMRGTGASEGSQAHPWPASDLDDLYDLVEWVVRQPWSNGQVGGFGNSYQATTAEMLGACGHPGVTSALVRFNEYDVYTDIAFPGGVPNQFMLHKWAQFNQALDANRVPASLPALDKIMVKGVKPVDGKPIPEHPNHQVDSVLRHVTFRDDLDPELGVTLDQTSIHTRPTSHFLDHWGSWFDAATADAVIRRFANNPRPQRAVIGPWNHGAAQHVGLQKNPFPLRSQMQEGLRCFDSPTTSRELHYFTLFENLWKTTEEFPPAGFNASRLYFQTADLLTAERPARESSATFEVDFSTSSGHNNRWQTELDQRPVRYDPIRAQLAYTSAALAADTEISGYPIVTLSLTSTHEDGNFFVYLETIDALNQVHYLSEGMLRAIQRKIAADAPPYKQFVPYHSFKRENALPLVPGERAQLTFGLNPISALIQAGWRLKVSISCADQDTFARIPAQGNPRITLTLGGESASFIELPTRTRGEIKSTIEAAAD